MSLSKKEHDEIRSWLVQAVSETLGYPESSVVTAAMQCVQRGCDAKATSGVCLNCNHQSNTILILHSENVSLAEETTLYA